MLLKATEIAYFNTIITTFAKTLHDQISIHAIISTT